MLRYIDHNNMGKGANAWIKSHFHFSFADYFDPTNIRFGVLKALNDDIIQPHNGFGLHPHSNMEIVTYIVDGELTHTDSAGYESKLTRGQLQYMSAGTGIAHSEQNNSDMPLRLLQVWILPDKEGYKPHYADYTFEWAERENKWLHLVSSFDNERRANAHQDVNIWVTELQKDKELDFKLGQGRQAYLVLIEGAALINGISLSAKDALEASEEHLTIKAKETAHILLIEMSKCNP